jgi:hypothetical protein
MDTETKVRRGDKVAVMFSPAMHERVSAQAAAYGMPVSTLCAFAVAAWVQQQEKNAAMARAAVLQVSRQAGADLGKLDLEGALQAAMVVLGRSMPGAVAPGAGAVGPSEVGK